VRWRHLLILLALSAVWWGALVCTGRLTPPWDAPPRPLELQRGTAR